ncbi:MAG: hypothetical protein KGD63_12075 [Candidatus Lokiarchaeota archaeon]|nr:hypothetical protein [Candidatus Lokiarchaeota archaeon]
MSEGPELPPIPSIGDVLGRKKRFIQKKSSVIRCKKCQGKYTRSFRSGDYTFKKIDNEKCPDCKEITQSTILEIYSEWIDPKKE